MPQENNLKPHPNRQLVLWLALPQLITWGSVYYTFALLLGPIEQALQLSRAQASLGFSLMLLADGLLALPLAKYLRNGHERVIMTAGTLLTALLLVLHSKIQTQWQFYAVWTGLGLAGSMCLYTPLFTVLTQRFPHHFRQSIITITLVAGLASTVFIPLSNACIDAWGWRNALLFLASLQLLICLPIHYFILQEKNFEHPLAAHQQNPVPAAKETRANWVILKKYLKMRDQVLITGATAGFGEACAHLFAEKGFDLILTGRRADRLDKLSALLKEKHGTTVVTLNFDVRDEDAVQKAIKERDLKVHGWVFDIKTGRLIDLKFNFEKALQEIMEIYRLED